MPPGFVSDHFVAPVRPSVPPSVHPQQLQHTEAAYNKFIPGPNIYIHTVLLALQLNPASNKWREAKLQAVVVVGWLVGLGLFLPVFTGCMG